MLGEGKQESIKLVVDCKKVNRDNIQHEVCLEFISYYKQEALDPRPHLL